MLKNFMYARPRLMAQALEWVQKDSEPKTEERLIQSGKWPATSVLL
jgi:hypothetical protein